MGLLDGKVALITGSGAGLGRGIARRFVREGAAVIVAEFNEATGETTARELRDELGGRALFVHTDVGRKEGITGAIQAAIDEFGGLDILVNNASALSKNVLLEQKSDEMLDRCLHVGVWAAWWGMRAVLPEFKRRGGGRIINFYSIDADVAAWMHSDYNINKAGVQALTRSAAAEWGRFNILSNCIAPTGAGTVWDAFKAENPEIAANVSKMNPVGRVGDAEEDIAPVVVFLASDMARYVNGETINVDGGMHLPGYDSRPPNLAELDGLPSAP